MIWVTVAMLMALLALSIPIAAALAALGLSLDYLYSWMPLRLALGEMSWGVSTDFILFAIPLFVLLGELLLRSGIAERMYAAMSQWLSWLPGGLMHSNIGTCTLFAAVSGSSVATAATIGTVAVGEIDRHGYNERLFLGTIAAGGTLGILIPPSIVLVIYGIMTDENIGHLFIAGIIPGILAISLLCLAVLLVVTVDPAAGPKGERQGWGERFRALKSIWIVVLLFVLILGGIYLGVFTATEGAGIGAGGALILSILLRTLTLKDFVKVLVDSAMTTAGLFMILIGALIFANFVNLTSMPRDLVALIESIDVPPSVVILFICAIYIVLGMAMEELSMIALTVPLFYPIVLEVVVVCQIGLTTPPIGINIFVVKSIVKDLPIREAFKGTWPFNLALVTLLVLLVLVPEIATFLPAKMR
jgi:C4-dicarboxylate transporter DctM subunit